MKKDPAIRREKTREQVDKRMEEARTIANARLSYPITNQEILRVYDALCDQESK